jgi:hypothetical protein
MRTAIALAAVSGLALLATACGGSSGTRSQGGGALAFSRCMRAHGVPAFPDPSRPGLIPKESLGQLGVGSTQLQSAQSACIHLVPNGGRPSPAQVAQYRSVMLVYARCIRAHGVSNMPDPDSRGHLDIGPGTGVDVDSPRFQAAYRACKSRLAP